MQSHEDKATPEAKTDVASQVGVRSKAVITYSASEGNAVYLRLPPRTDLNNAPSNWLRKTIGLRPEVVLPGSRYISNRNQLFSGFAMAGNHLKHVGKVDVVSDAENIKKLLKIPYSNAHTSMAIHRVGRTLLLENFDMKKYSEQGSRWTWFRDFYRELFQQSDDHTLLKKKSPSSQNDRMMLSKFLYYSVYQESCNKLEDRSVTPRSPSRKSDVESNIGIPRLPNILKPDHFAQEQSERRWKYWTPHENLPQGSQTFDDEAFRFERNILWTFEDLKMILGTNMPIFGGGKYPAVSLRLRDSQKPINILTGIDYWLDNLICNVPELVMCFHVEGIVQNYEFIKTEDIPKLKDSSFSPQVIKDIAQNILSFLKSNCTKEGHTYWLFKGSGDDVIKLYDLSTLCQGSGGDAQGSQHQNPYVISVAMLLYKTAMNLMQSQDSCNHHNTVRKLLLHCVQLLDQTKHQEVAGHAACLLSSLFLPQLKIGAHMDSQSESKQDYSYSHPKDWKTCDTCAAYSEAEESLQEREAKHDNCTEIASISSVSDLYYPKKFVSLSPSSESHHSQDTRGVPAEVEKDCLESLRHIVMGFDILLGDPQTNGNKLLCDLTKNASIAYFKLAEKANIVGKLGSALKRSRLALRCCETLDFLKSQSQIHDSSSVESVHALELDLLMPNLLSLCGEVQLKLVHEMRASSDPKMSHFEELDSAVEYEAAILKSLEAIFGSGEC